MDLGDYLLWGLLAIPLLGLGISQVTRGPEDDVLVGVARFLNLIVVRTLHRVRVYDVAARRIREALPASGPVIVVANHRSGSDPNLLAATTKRWIVFLMAREYYEMRGLRWLFRALDCIPVRRDGNDLAATRRALEKLRDGRVIGIFPQGGIRDEDDDFAVTKAGVALLAAKSGAPVVPIYIEGSPIEENVFRSLLLRTSRTRIHCGAPLLPSSMSVKPSRQELDGFTEGIIATLRELREHARAQRG